MEKKDGKKYIMKKLIKIIYISVLIWLLDKIEYKLESILWGNVV